MPIKKKSNKPTPKIINPKPLYFFIVSTLNELYLVKPHLKTEPLLSNPSPKAFYRKVYH
jgi:hypothetical protein